MPKREEIHIRQSTNLYDLLDDGVENGSDLPTLITLRANQAPNMADESPSSSDSSSRQTSELQRGHRSWGGALLGVALSAAGSAAAVWPMEMMVWHTRIRYLPSFAEHVTRVEARGYGIAVAMVGLAVLSLSLVRMPRPRGRI